MTDYEIRPSVSLRFDLLQRDVKSGSAMLDVSISTHVFRDSSKSHVGEARASRPGIQGL